MKKIFSSFLLLFTAVLFSGAWGYGLNNDASSGEPVRRGDGTVVSRHTITLESGKPLKYTARAGFIPLRRDDAGDPGELLGEMFFIAYTADGAPGAKPRPITFCWSGGPGCGATLSHESPRLTKPVGDPRFSQRYEVVDNPKTPLAVTDLVFIDPIGTGYSRPAKPEFAELFFSIDGDGESITEFIRIYLRRYDVLNQPIFLKGGSYGSIRCAMVAGAAERRSIPIRGVIMTALALLEDTDNDVISYVTALPSFTAAAFFHKKLAPDLMEDREKTLRESERWAIGDYLAALYRGNTLTGEEREAVVAAYARYSGLDPEVVEANNLRIRVETFTNELLRSEGRIIGQYDTRISEESLPKKFDPTTDPSLMAKGVAMPKPMERLYLSRELGVTADLLGPKVDGVHLGPFGGAWPPPRGGAWPEAAVKSREWMAVRWKFGFEKNNTIPSLLGALERNKDLHVLMIGGEFDLATPYFVGDYIASRARPGDRERIVALHVETGHGVTEEVLHREVQKFMQDVLAKPLQPKPRDFGWQP